MTKELSPTAKKLRDRALSRSSGVDAENSRTPLGKVAYEVGVTARFVASLTKVLTWMWLTFGLPIWTVVLSPGGRWVIGKWIELWNWWTPYKDEFGNDKTSRIKGGSMILATLMVPFVAVTMFLFVVDAGFYTVHTALGHQNQVVWLASAQEIDPGGNVFSVQGCERLIEQDDGSKTCSEANTLYYRVKPSLFNQVWSLASGHGVFFPHRVVAAVGADWSKCTIESYGNRFKLFMFLLDVYPNLLSASCTRSGA